MEGVSARGKENVRTISLRVLYDCEQLCQVTHENPAGDMDARAACRCSLPGFDRTRWNRDALPDAAAEAEQLLSSLIHGAEQQGTVLDHDLDRDGCPWGWALSRFAGSVAAYSSPRASDSPVRGQCARLWLRDPKPSTALLEQVRYLESVEDRAFNRYRNLANP